MLKCKIGCLTYKKLNILTRSAIKKINDPEIEITLIEGLMENLTDRVNEAIKDGIDVFVGGGANARTINRTTEANVVNIMLTALDYIQALTTAKKYSKKIAIVNFIDTPIIDFKKLENILDVEIHPIVFHEPEELTIKLKESQVEVVVGASLSNEIANNIGLKNVLIYPGDDAIISAIQEAKKIAIALRKEREKSKIIQAILDFSPTGFIATDERSNIIIFNPAAEKIMRVSSQKAMGSSIDKVLPECKLSSVLTTKLPQLNIINTVNNTDIVVNRIPIEIGGDIVGSVGIIQPVSEIQKTEQKIRMLNKEKGFTAKNRFNNIIGNSKILQEKVNEAKLFSKSNFNILIYGETGVGKEIFAQSIHNYSLKKDGPFVAINCAALPENLLESELFGYDEGAFTGSKKGGKPGIFEIAHGGTLLLDEIGELSPALQTRLLRILQEKEVMRLGGDRVIPVDVRVIAATNKNLEKKIPHEFRNDLFYRLNVLQLNIPCLWEREDDVIQLFMHFFKKNMSINQYKIVIPQKTLNILKYYSWPGNIRELQNVSERFSLFSKNSTRFDEIALTEILVKSIGEDKLFEDLLKQYNIKIEGNHKVKNIPNELLDALKFVFPGKKTKIAQKLGISRTTLWRVLNRQ